MENKLKKLLIEKELLKKELKLVSKEVINMDTFKEDIKAEEEIKNKIDNIDYKIYDVKRKLNDEMKNDSNIINFKKEIIEICKKYNLSISHEDCHGGFIITEYNEYCTNWFNNADVNKY